MEKKYQDKSPKYTCKECDFTTNFIGIAWEHRLEEHPDESE